MTWHGFNGGRTAAGSGQRRSTSVARAAAPAIGLILLVAVGSTVVAGCSSTSSGSGGNARQAFYARWRDKFEPLATKAGPRSDCEVVPSEPCSEAMRALVGAADQLQTEIEARPDKDDYSDVTTAIATLDKDYTNFTDNARCTTLVASFNCPVVAGGLSIDLANVMQALSLVT